jgi:hypothetical protein
MMGELADKLAGTATAPSRLRVDDTGDRIHIEPEGMQVPKYGKGLNWGVTAYRGQLRNQGDRPRIYVRDARLPEDLQGSGAGVAMYEHLARMGQAEGLRFQSDGAVTNDAVKMWAALKRRGHNVQTAPNHSYRAGPAEAPNLGHYETPDGGPVFWIDPATGK